MKLKPADKNINLNSFNHSLRAAQTILQYGVGAMVDFPEQSLMTAAPEYWSEHVYKIYDERLEKSLDVEYFGMPGDKDDPKLRDGLAFVRFPEWYFCPKCRKFQPINKWVKEYKESAKVSQKMKDADPEMLKFLRCTKCNQELVVARIVTVCEHGHIDDFPWIEWVHGKNMTGQKPICSNPSLTFKTTASAAEGLEGLTISCESCGAKATLQGAFSEDAFEALDKKTNYQYNLFCKGKHPWKHMYEQCTCYPKAVQRGSSSVYFPVIETSLVIPPYSSYITKKIETSEKYSDFKKDIKTAIDTMKQFVSEDQISSMRTKIISDKIDSYSHQIALAVSLKEEQVKEVLERKWLNDKGEFYSTTSVKYKAEEYEALSGEVTLNQDLSDDFYREEMNIDDYNLPFVKQISLIHKLREVQALTGFSRLKPAERPINKTDEKNNETAFVSIKEPETEWYPAYQVRGEGIFIEFDDESIKDWIKSNPQLIDRVGILNENYKKSFIGKSRPREITPKFLLLHTISHLLIKQLSFECGYSIASLKERLYCAEEDDGKNMAGIFIYTASGDSEGTLGGLVRQGREDTFPEIFKKAIENAIFCSNDPVCSLTQGQGRDSLNLAACYSCTLIPETSCEEFNVFLDRGTVVGTLDDKKMAFFFKQLYGEEGWKNNISHKVKKEKKSSQIDSKEICSYSINDYGIDLIDQDYYEIWSNIKEWCNDELELDTIEQLQAFFAEEHNINEKPNKDVEIFILNGNKIAVCDLFWKDKKIAYFTSDNEEDYQFVRENTNIICFIGNSMDLNAFKNLMKEV